VQGEFRCSVRSIQHLADQKISILIVDRPPNRPVQCHRATASANAGLNPDRSVSFRTKFLLCANRRQYVLSKLGAITDYLNWRMGAPLLRIRSAARCDGIFSEALLGAQGGRSSADVPAYRCGPPPSAGLFGRFWPPTPLPGTAHERRDQHGDHVQPKVWKCMECFDFWIKSPMATTWISQDCMRDFSP
jgi:hypothetical protein